MIVQHEPFDRGVDLSIPGNEQLPRLKEFILPAGTRAAALVHVNHTLARRT